MTNIGASWDRFLSLYQMIERENSDKALEMAKKVFWDSTSTKVEEEATVIKIKNPRMRHRTLVFKDMQLVFDAEGVAKIPLKFKTECDLFLQSKPGYEVLEDGKCGLLNKYKQATVAERENEVLKQIAEEVRHIINVPDKEEEVKPEVRIESGFSKLLGSKDLKKKKKIAKK